MLFPKSRAVPRSPAPPALLARPHRLGVADALAPPSTNGLVLLRHSAQRSTHAPLGRPSSPGLRDSAGCAEHLDAPPSPSSNEHAKLQADIPNGGHSSVEIADPSQNDVEMCERCLKVLIQSPHEFDLSLMSPSFRAQLKHIHRKSVAVRKLLRKQIDILEEEYNALRSAFTSFRRELAVAALKGKALSGYQK